MFALLLGRHACCFGCDFRQAFLLGHFLEPFECYPSMELDGGMSSFGNLLGHFLENFACYPSEDLDGGMIYFYFLPHFLDHLRGWKWSPVGEVLIRWRKWVL